MKLLDDISSKHIIALDIETVRIKEYYKDLSPEWQSAWGYKCKQDGEIPSNSELRILWEKNASLYAEFSKVCAVSLAFLDTTGNKLFCKEFFGEDETAILSNLKVMLDKISSKDKSFRLVGHAAKFFDYPYLCKRYVINNLYIPSILDTAHLKPWESQNLCTNNDIWKMGGTGAGSSLQALCTCLNIPISKVDLVADGVGEAYFKKEFKRIATYCSLDTIATFNVVRRIKMESIFEFKDVIYLNEDKDSSATPINGQSFLEKVYNTDSLSPEIRKGIEGVFSKKKKPTEIEIAGIKDILMGAYVQCTFEGGKFPDSESVIIAKGLEVDEYLKTL